MSVNGYCGNLQWKSSLALATPSMTLATPFKPGAPVDQELFVRSAQVHALSPMMQFSAAPWRVLDAEHFAAVKAAVDLRQRFVPRMLELAKESARTGEPMLRNLEYVFPGRGYEDVKDEFLLGNDILVAPVLTEGATARTVILPPGKWQAEDGAVYEGPKMIDVPAPLAKLPYFVSK